MSSCNVICRRTRLRPDDSARGALLIPRLSLPAVSAELSRSSPRNKLHICFPRSLVKRDIHPVTPRNLSSTCSFLCAANVYCIHSWCQILCQVQEDRRACQSTGGRVFCGGLCGVCGSGEKGSFSEVGVLHGRAAVASGPCERLPRRSPFLAPAPKLPGTFRACRLPRQQPWTQNVAVQISAVSAFLH